MKVLMSKSNINYLESKEFNPDTYLQDYYEAIETAGICSDVIVLNNPDGTTQNFSVNQFLMANSDVTKEKLAAWLKLNDSMISFENAYDIIECAHMNDDERAYEYMNLIAPTDSMTLGSIKTRIANLGGLYTDNYQHYLDFDFDTSGKITFSLITNYDPNAGCFSIPLFKSIEKNQGLSNNSIIEFRKVDLYGPNRIVFSVLDNNGKPIFYDFSQIPPGTTVILRHLFSPL